MQFPVANRRVPVTVPRQCHGCPDVGEGDSHAANMSRDPYYWVGHENYGRRCRRQQSGSGQPLPEGSRPRTWPRLHCATNQSQATKKSIKSGCSSPAAGSNARPLQASNRIHGRSSETATAVRKAERKLGVKLPSVYLEQLAIQNGGYVGERCPTLSCNCLTTAQAIDVNTEHLASTCSRASCTWGSGRSPNRCKRHDIQSMSNLHIELLA